VHSEVATSPAMQRRDARDDRVTERPLRLVVADDHEATRAGVRRALGPLGFTFAAEAADADSAVRAVVRVRPDACLIATHLPGGGIRAATKIHASAPEVGIVMLGTADDEGELFAALDAGAGGYLLKDIGPTALGNALRGLKRGEAAIPRYLVARLVSEFRARRAAGDGQERTTLAPLTARQLCVLEHLSNGCSNAEIARRLAISPITVRRHTSSIVARLGVGNRDGAIDAYRAARGTSGGRLTIGGDSPISAR
jgi:DNA-binding NarL/FixJ family response regulator